MALEAVALVLIACDGFGFLVCSKLPSGEEPVELLFGFSVHLRQHGFEEPVGLAKSNQQIVTLHGVYPLLFLTMTPVALWFGKQNKLRDILRYFGTSLTVILTAGLLLNVIFGWARYFIPLIPVCLILVGPMVLRSKYWLVWAILYFALGVYGTFLQAHFVMSFQRSMTP